MPTKDDAAGLSSDEQLALWVAGEAVHRGVRPDGECCPDFSCCNPKMFTEKSEREAFRDATEDIRHSMLMTFLGRALSGHEVYLAGDPTNYQELS